MSIIDIRHGCLDIGRDVVVGHRMVIMEIVVRSASWEVSATCWAVPPLAMDPGMSHKMVNTNPPHLIDLEIESTKTLFWSINVMSSSETPASTVTFYASFVPEIVCSEAGEEMEDFMLLARDKFISAILRMRAANSNGD